MANDNTIKTFTAADIEKYHKGQLSSKEMHQLEKAALDDPFLADALEGYAVAGMNVSADIAELKKRLTDKTEKAKVIPIGGGGSSSFPWLRAAALVILIAGAGLLSYQFLFRTEASDNKIAQSPTETEKAKVPDTAKTQTPTYYKDSSLEHATTTTTATGSSTLYDKATTESVIQEQKNLTIGDDASKSLIGDLDSNKRSKYDPYKDIPLTTPPVKIAEGDISTKSLRNDNALDKSSVVEINKDLSLKKPVDKDANGAVAMQEKAKEEITVQGYGAKRSDNFTRNYTTVFRGRVTDAHNNALPFANITNTVDNVGTYSDARGNFTLVSTDTVLSVQVRSLGFENNNVQLRGYVAGNQVMLQEDRSLDARILDTVKRNLSRARNNTMTFEEPEPEDGWGPYGSYLVNNINTSEKYDIKKTRATTDNVVEVSFDVTKNGDPVNIKVEKSLCDKCDKEAIRLIKEGPKWKRKAKKGKRTIVAVPFIKTD